MKTEVFSITDKEYYKLKEKFSKEGKSSHVGGWTMEIVKLYFQSKGKKTNIDTSRSGADMIVGSGDKAKSYEVKGTQDSKIAFSKLKVSSKKSHTALVNGLEMIRVTNIGQRTVKLHFMKHGIDFELVEEPRWAVKPIRNSETI